MRPVMGPAVNGIAPIFEESPDEEFNNYYQDLKCFLPYSGGVLLANCPIEYLYFDMGFQPAWAHRAVIELIFEGGVLKAEFDRSKDIAKVRTALSTAAQRREPWMIASDKEISEFIERAFDRRYEELPPP